MFEWKNGKKNKNNNANSTAGKQKGENCQADWLKKYYTHR